MSLLIQRANRKFTCNLPSIWIATFIFAGIVAITPSLASAEQASCTAEEAAKSGISHFSRKNPPDPVGETVFSDRNGNEARISDYRGTALVINFWATWCPPCVAEMPSLDRLKGILADSGIDVLAINEDRGGAPVALKFYETNDIVNLDVLVDRKMALLKEREVKGLPTTLLVDADGYEVAAVVGEAHWDAPDVVELVKACLLPEAPLQEAQRTSGS